MEKDLTPEQSLATIQAMMNEAKKSFHRMSYYFLLWGILLVLAMLSTVLTSIAGWEDRGYAWVGAGILGGILSTVHGAREGRRERVQTVADRVLMWLWVGFIITLVSIMVGAGVAGYNTPVGTIMIITGLPTFTTGQMMRFRPLILGGMLFWVLGAACFFVEPLIIAILYMVAMVFGYIVPGYLLKRQEDVVRAT